MQFVRLLVCFVVVFAAFTSFDNNLVTGKEVTTSAAAEEENPDEGGFHPPPEGPANQATIARPIECTFSAKLTVNGTCKICDWTKENLDHRGNCRKIWGR